VLLFGEPRKGILADSYKRPNGKITEYDVRIVDEGAETPLSRALAQKPAGVNLCGLTAGSVHADKRSAVNELIGRYQRVQTMLDIALDDCYMNANDPDVVLDRLKKFERMSKEVL
jgi:hypothetical protein